LKKKAPGALFPGRKERKEEKTPHSDLSKPPKRAEKTVLHGVFSWFLLKLQKVAKRFFFPLFLMFRQFFGTVSGMSRMLTV